MCALRASCPRQAHASKIVTDADNRSHMRAWPAPYAYYTLNKPTPTAQDETYGLRRKILGLRPLPPRNLRNRTTKKSCAFNVTGVLDIIRRPLKFSYYLKFHGARTAFCRVIEGTMTSAGHRLHTSDGHRTNLVWNSNRTIKRRPGIVRCVKRARNFRKSLYKSAGACFMSRAAAGEKRRVLAEVPIESIYRYFICEDQKLKFNYICFAWGANLMNNMQRKSSIEMFAILSKCCFHIHHCQSQHQCFLF